MPDSSKLSFRVLDSLPRRAAEHMALDEVIVSAHSQKLIPNTLRFLQFKPCALVGLHQNTYLEVNVDYCLKQGLDINRRITGGGSLYWGPLELGWEMYAAKDTPGIPRRVADMYRLLCEGTALGLKQLGLNAAFRPVNDIEINGRKIAGTGGTELQQSFVFQCSLLVDFNVEEMLRVLNLPVEKLGDKAADSMRERVTSMKEQLGYVPEQAAIKQAVLAGLAQSLNFDFTPGELTAEEVSMFTARLPHFQSADWIYGNDQGYSNTLDSLVSYKAPGGLIRLQMRLDDKLQIIKYVIITGDFFAYPARVINDLETILKNTSTAEDPIAERVQTFFDHYQADIPGVTADHFIKALQLSVQSARSHQLKQR
jgi:lipoate-protein ligase A